MSNIKTTLVSALLTTTIGLSMSVNAQTASEVANSLKNTAIDKAKSFTNNLAETSLESLVDRTEVTIEGFEGSKPTFSILTTQPITESEDLKDTTFWQGSIFSNDGRETLNLGLGYRRLSDDEKWLYGVNAFYDHEFPYDHRRASIGGEVRSSLVELNVNKYYGLSNALTGENGVQETALGGFEFELGTQIPYIPGTKLFAKQFKWDGEDGGADLKGKTYSLDIGREILTNTSLEAGIHDYDGTKASEKFAKLTYYFGKQSKPAKPFISTVAFEKLKSMKDNRLDKVRRTNTIVKQKGGFTVSIR
jgi:adhesin/invasin